MGLQPTVTNRLRTQRPFLKLDAIPAELLVSGFGVTPCLWLPLVVTFRASSHPLEEHEASSDMLPRFDRWFASKMSEPRNLEHVPDRAIEIQAHVDALGLLVVVE